MQGFAGVSIETQFMGFEGELQEGGLLQTVWVDVYS